jgi:hypothetical protein
MIFLSQNTCHHANTSSPLHFNFSSFAKMKNTRLRMRKWVLLVALALTSTKLGAEARSEAYAYEPNNAWSTLAGTTTADFQFMMQQPLPYALPAAVAQPPVVLAPYVQPAWTVLKVD